MNGMPSMGGEGTEGAGGDLDFDADLYMGHEFSAEVLEIGPDTVAPKLGTLVTSIPILFTAGGVKPIVFSNAIPGGYGERMLLSAPLIAEVRSGLDFSHAAITEPRAVGQHAKQEQPRVGTESEVTYKE